MFKRSWVIFSCLAGGLGAAAATSPGPAPAAVAVTLNSTGATAPQLLRDIPQLQQAVTVDATDRPLGDVLATLSPTLPVDLRAERDVADQRVTLHLTGQPAYLLMDRLVRLLSHSPDSPHGYHWERLDRGAGARPAFRLWRDSGSVTEEAYARDYPQREIGVLLRDLRDMAGMTPQEQDGYNGDYPHPLSDPQAQPFGKALRGLSDDQLDALVAGQALPLDPALLADDMGAARQLQTDRMLRTHKRLIAVGLPDPYPHGLPNVFQPSPPMLTVTPTGGLAGDDALGAPGQYLITLEGTSIGSMVLDTYDTKKSRSPDYLPPPDSKGLVVDLTPLLTAAGVTRAQRADVGFTLQALARAAHLTVYQEAFLPGSAKDTFVQPDDPAVGLKPLRAPLPVLIAAICAHWDYQCRKVGDDYLFWSRTWAQDRADDVPERLIGPWRQRLQKNGYLSLDDRAEMAAAITYPQASRTLAVALPESGPWNDGSYPSLRFIGQLAPGQEQQASSGDGLPLASLVPWQQEALTAAFKRQIQDIPNDQLDRTVLTLQSDSDPQMSRQYTVMNITADGKRLFAAHFSVLLPKTPAPSPTGAATPTGGG